MLEVMRDLLQSCYLRSNVAHKQLAQTSLKFLILVPSNYVLRSLLNGTLLSLSRELFIEASFARGISSSSELSLPTSCKTYFSLVSVSLLVAESSLGAELVTLDLGPLVSLIRLYRTAAILD